MQPVRLMAGLLAFTALLAAQRFDVVEATIPQMRDAMAQGKVTSRELVVAYLGRIATYENQLHAAITVNPRALQEAEARDAERVQGRVRGPLHGIPIAIKDNILTNDIVTTGGALVFAGFIPPYDATLVKNLRDAGAVIIAKTNLSEWAGWLSSAPSPVPGNYTGVRGYGYNPYDPRKDPRPGYQDGRPVMNTGGSSSGAGTTTSFWAANVGTETSGSILNPANQNMLAAIKPTVGRVSRWGVIPVTLDQDTAGPMGRTMTDAAILLGALESPRPDPNDPATTTCALTPNRDYTVFLKADGLKGVRIGIPRAFFFNPATPPGATAPRGGLAPEQAKLMAEAIAIMKSQGAIIVDPADLPSVVDKDPARNVLNFFFCAAINQAKGKDANCSVDLKYGMKRDFNKWLATLGSTAPVKTLTELRNWNNAHITQGAIRYGQFTLDISDEMDLEADKARYEADRKKDIDLAGTHGIDEVMKANRLDAILFPGSTGTTIVDKPGYPSVIVPFGMVPNRPTGQFGGVATAPGPDFPKGFNARPAPYGVSFAGAACSEGKLIQIGYAFEQASKRRVPPPNLP